MKTRHVLATSIAALFAGAFTPVHAQIVWDAGSLLNFDWSVGTNWTGVPDNTEPGALDDVIFQTPIPNPGVLADPNKITLSAGELGNSLDIRDAYVLTGGDLTLTVGDIVVSPGITAEIASSLLGTAITKRDTGTLILVGANSYTGLTTVNEGVLSVQNALALGTTAGGTTVAGGAALEIQNLTSIAGEALTLNGTGILGGGALRSVSPGNSFTGAITLGSASTIASDSGLLTVGAIALGANALTFDGAGDITVSGTATSTATTATITKEGAGTLTFTADPNSTGVYTVNRGVMVLNHTGTTDAATIVNSGGTLRTLTAAIADTRDVTVNGTGIYDIRLGDTIGRLLGDGLVKNDSAAAVTLAVNATTAGTFSGVIQNGISALALTKGNSVNAFTLTGTNTYTGTTTINQGTLAVTGNTGSIAASTQITLARNDSVAVFGSNLDTLAVQDRIGAATEIEVQDGGEVVFNGAVAAATTESMGQLESNTGHDIVTLNPAAGGQFDLTATTLLRSNNSTFLIRGTGLGSAAGADTSRIIFTTTPAMNGDGGLAGTTNISIVRHVAGDTAAAGSGSSFVTHDANGIRLLASGEYLSAMTNGVGLVHNVSLSAAHPALTHSGTGINALRLQTGGSVTLNLGAKLTVFAASILDVSATGGNIGGAGNLEFGANQAIFLLSGPDAATAITTTISAGMSGSGGMALSAFNPASKLVLSGWNAMSNDIVINHGILEIGNMMAVNPFVRQDLRFASEGQTGSAVLRLNGFSGSYGQLDTHHNGTIENGAGTAATIAIAQASDIDTNLVLRDGGAGKLNLVQNGANRLSFVQDSPAFTGTATTRAGTLEVKNGADWDALGAVVIEGGTFKWFNQTGANNNSDRLPGGLDVTMRGGQIFGDHINSTTDNSTEQIGALILEAGVNTINVDFNTTAARQSTIVFNEGNSTAASLQRSRGAVARFIATGGTLGQSQQARIQLGQNLAVTATSADLIKNGILAENGIAYAVVGDDFATINATDLIAGGAVGNMDFSVAAIGSGGATGSYQTSTDATMWAAADNVKLSTGLTVLPAGPTTINSLILGDGVNLDLDGETLTVDAGGILAVTSTAAGPVKTIGNGSITGGAFAGSEIVLRAGDNANTATAGSVDLSATVIDNGPNATALTKWGGKSLTLSGANTFTGDLSITEGALLAANAGNLGVSAPGRTLRMAGLTTLDLSPMPADLTLPFEAIDISTIGAATGNPEAVIRGARGFTVNYTGRAFGIGGLRFQNTSDIVFTTPLNLRDGLTVGDNDGGTAPPAALPVSDVTLAAGDNVIGGRLNIGIRQREAVLTQPGGTLSVGLDQFVPDLNIGFRDTDSLATTTATRGVVDLSGTSQFTAQVNLIRIGVITAAGASGSARGDLILGTNSDVKSGGGIVLGDSPNAGNGGVTSSIRFGAGIHNWSAPSFFVGGRKSNAIVTLGGGGTLNLSGVAGAGIGLSIGDQRDADTGSAANGTFDMSAGTFTGAIAALQIGDKERTGIATGGVGGATGTMTLGSSAGNNVLASNVLIGRMQNSSGATAAGSKGEGTLNFGGGAFSVTADVTMGAWSDGAAPDSGTAKGTLSITGGTFTVGGSIMKTDNDRSSAIVIVNGGTLDLHFQSSGDPAPGTIAASQLAFRAGAIIDIATAGATLDGRGVTNGLVFAPLDDALIVRDVAVPFAVALTNATADKGGIHYESAGGGTGATISGALDFGSVARIVNVEDSAGAIDDLALTGAIANVPTLTKTGAGKLLIDTVLGSGTTTLNAKVGETHLAQSQTLAALNIDDGAIVTLADVPPFSPAPGFDDTGLLAPTAAAAVPELGALSLLGLGALALLRRRR